MFVDFGIVVGSNGNEERNNLLSRIKKKRSFFFNNFCRFFNTFFYLFLGRLYFSCKLSKTSCKVHNAITNNKALFIGSRIKKEGFTPLS